MMWVAAVALSLTLHATVTPNKAAQLATVNINMALTNRSRTPATLEFPTPDLFWVQIRDVHGKAIFDSRTGHKPIDVRRKLFVPTGTTGVAIFDWNGLDDDRRAPDPGDYVVHVEMESMTARLVSDLPLTILAPVPIAAAMSAATKNLLTIAGTVTVEGSTTYLEDSSGRAALSGPLGLRPQGAFVVRGAPYTNPDQRRILLINRFAPAATNLEPQAIATPRPSPSVILPVPRRSG